MGRDKARLSRDGEAWSTRAARMLSGAFEEVLLVGGNPESEAPGRRVPDPPGTACALRGLVGALESAASPRVLVVATDLPFLSIDLLLALSAWPERDAVVPTDPAGDHPLCAIYRRESCLAIASAHLAAERLSLRELLAEVETDRVSLEALGLADLEPSPLVNINTPAELARLEAS